MNKKKEKQKNKTLKNSLEQSLKNINNKNPNSKFLNYNKNKPKKNGKFIIIKFLCLG